MNAVVRHVHVPSFDRHHLSAVLMDRFVPEGGTVRWGHPVGRLHTEVGPVPVWCGSGGQVSWSVNAGDLVQTGDILCRVTSAAEPPISDALAMEGQRATILIVYYGHVPNYFSLFLRGCAENPWLTVQIIGDPQLPAHCQPPSNVVIHRLSLAEVLERSRRVFGFVPSIRRPYKFCDLKPAYLELFDDFTTGFEWAGWGDLDLIYGDMGYYLRQALRLPCQMILRQGSFCLCRRNGLMTSLYRTQLHGVPSFREVFQDPVNRIFDEFGGFASIASLMNVPLFIPPIVADTNHMRSDLRLSEAWGREHNYERQVITWRSGRLYREAWDGDRYQRRELGYVHFQKRRFRSPPEHLGDSFVIGASGFHPLECNADRVSRDSMQRLNPRRPMQDLLRQAYGPARRLSRKWRERRLRREQGFEQLAF